MNLSQITDLELRKELRKRNQLRKKRSRQAHGLGPRKKGMGVRIGDRDEAARLARGYKEDGSYVRRDGSEKLVGMDWRIRKQELWQREHGQCEWTYGELKAHDGMVAADRCVAVGSDPHHVKPRGRYRDDRLSNLMLLCRQHHREIDSRKINGDAAKRGYCIKHSRALLDIGGEKKCTACRDEQRAREKEKAGS